MPKAYGSDVLQEGPDGALVLVTTRSKGWISRIPRSPLNPLTPGTAVRWEEEFWEVVDAEDLADGSARYRLLPWDDLQIFRVIQDYSEAAEEARASERRAALAMQAGRQTSVLMAPLLGHLPGSVQERLELEVGVRASWLTIASAVPLFLFGVFCVVWTIIMMFGGLYGVGDKLIVFSPTVLALGWYLFLESALRLVPALTQDRPVGSLAGTLGYALYLIVRHGPTGAPPGEAGLPEEPVAMGDYETFHMVEPLLALLPARDQAMLETKYGFEARRWGMHTALLLLFVLAPFAIYDVRLLRAGAGGAGALFWLIVNGGLCAEQLGRLALILGGRAAPSVLGILFRPLARKLLPALA